MRWHGGGRDRNSSKSTLPSSKGPQPSEMIGISSNFEVEDTHSERGPSSRNNDTINYTGDIRQGHYHDSDLLMTGGLPRSSTESSNLDDSQQAYAEKIFEEDMDLPGFDS